MNRRLSVMIVACLALAAAPSLSFGQATEGEPGVRLTLSRALEMALENNLDLVVARKDPAISEQNVLAQQGAFDLNLTSGANHSDSEQEISNLFSLTNRTTDRIDFGLSQNLDFGANYGVSLVNTRSEALGPAVTTSTTYSSSLSLTFNLPLLRGLGKEVASEQILLARGNLEISREDLRRQAHTTLEAAEGAYWDVKAARAALGVAVRKLNRAEDLLELNKKKVDVGTLAPIEITQAEAGVASSEEGVIVAETQLENAEDELLRLLAIPEADPMWEQPVIAIDEPSRARVAIDLQEAIDTALTRRPEMETVRRTLRNNELSERVARNAVRPRLDLALSAQPSGNDFETIILGPGPDGIPGTFDDEVETVTEGNFSEALTEIPDLDNLDWSVGLEFAIPVKNRAAKASYAIATLNREKSEIAQLNQEQSIRVETRRAVREVESGKKRVDAARANVVLQQKKLEAEVKKFENGMSTSFEVLTFQNDLADAELGEIRALLDYTKALTALERVKGTLLEARNLTLAP